MSVLCPRKIDKAYKHHYVLIIEAAGAQHNFGPVLTSLFVCSDFSASKSEGLSNM